MTFSTEAFTPVWSALGTSVVHFLWQGAILGLVTALVLGALRRRSSEVRYGVAYAALLLSLVSFVGTFASALGLPRVAGGGGEPSLAEAGRSAALTLASSPRASGIAAWLWTAGVLCLVLRSLANVLGVRRLETTAVSAVDARWQRVFDSLKEELGVDRAVRVLASGLAEVPMVVGWFSPLVLVPVSVFTQLSPDQLRSLLAHELAHVRRKDHWFNAVQAAIEIVLFFHPAVWWISSQVRAEREYCCDDSSVRVTGDPRLLAEALAALETIRLTAPTSSIALAANGGPLMKRISRILDVNPARTNVASWQLPAGVVLAGLLALAGSALAAPASGQDTRKVRVVDEGRVPHEVKEHPADDFEAHAGRIKRALKAGEITMEVAERTLAAMVLRRQHAQALARIESAVRDGKMTQEEAEKHLAELRARSEHLVKRMHPREDPEAAVRKIQAAVETGRITPEEGRVRIEAYRRALAQRRPVDPETQLREIQAAVEAGELSAEEGRAKIGAITKKIAERDVAVRKIRAAVESGRLTPKEAEAKLDALHEGWFERRTASRHHADVDQVLHELEAAVGAGKLTPEQARARLEALKKDVKERSLVKQRGRR